MNYNVRYIFCDTYGKGSVNIEGVAVMHGDNGPFVKDGRTSALKLNRTRPPPRWLNQNDPPPVHNGSAFYLYPQTPHFQRRRWKERDSSLTDTATEYQNRPGRPLGERLAINGSIYGRKARPDVPRCA